jgi:hypothetical protein
MLAIPKAAHLMMDIARGSQCLWYHFLCLSAILTQILWNYQPGRSGLLSVLVFLASGILYPALFALE